MTIDGDVNEGMRTYRMAHNTMNRFLM